MPSVNIESLEDYKKIVRCSFRWIQLFFLSLTFKLTCRFSVIAAPLLYASMQIGPFDARKYYLNSNATLTTAMNTDGSDSTKSTVKINLKLQRFIQEVQPILCVKFIYGQVEA